jgi:hypothetical protein
LNLAKEAGQPSPAIDNPESLVDFSFVREARRTISKQSAARSLKGQAK